MSERRLPVYFLLDCSESMIGPAVSAVQSGVETMIRELRRDPQALETAHVSLITFDQVARQITPLTELLQVQVPKLRVGPGTALGAGLKMLHECINREVRVTTPDRKGDYRPLAFLLTDGQPTDDWESGAQVLAGATGTRVANLYAIGCGDDVNYDILGKVSDIVFRQDEMTNEKMNKLFVWLTASVQAASVAAGSSSGNEIDLSKLPPDVQVAKPGSYTPPSGPPRQVFVSAMCSTSGGAYVMRYRLDPQCEWYAPVASHPLEDENERRRHLELPPLKASNLDGVPACCHCGNAGAGVCGCGTVLCLPVPPPAQLACPACRQNISLSNNGTTDFDIRQSQG